MNSNIAKRSPKRSPKHAKKGKKSAKHAKKSAKHSAKHAKKGKKSSKRSSKRSPKHKLSEYNIHSVMKLFYDMTLKNLVDANKAVLEVDKDTNTLAGKASMNELLSMPWMFNVKPLVNQLWASVPEPYNFVIVFAQVKDKEIQKTLSIYNGSAYILKNQNLNVLVK